MRKRAAVDRRMPPSLRAPSTRCRRRIHYRSRALIVLKPGKGRTWQRHPKQHRETRNDRNMQAVTARTARIPAGDGMALSGVEQREM